MPKNKAITIEKMLLFFFKRTIFDWIMATFSLLFKCLPLIFDCICLRRILEVQSQKKGENDMHTIEVDGKTFNTEGIEIQEEERVSRGWMRKWPWLHKAMPSLFSSIHSNPMPDSFSQAVPTLAAYRACHWHQVEELPTLPGCLNVAYSHVLR